MTTNVLQTTLKFLLVLALAMPIGLAIAGQGGVQILKCAESVGITFGENKGSILGLLDPDNAGNGFGPTVVMIEGDFPEPETCSPLGSCTECLRDLITESRCRARDFPGTPLIVHSSTQEINVTDGKDLLFFTITEHVFLCRGGGDGDE